MPSTITSSPDFSARSLLRKAIVEAFRTPEAECVEKLTPAASLSAEEERSTTAVATRLATALRARRNPGLVETLVQEFSLSSAEGVALMCMAEALLRIPDVATRDALIHDKIGESDWLAHVGRGKPLFANAAAWGLALTGRIVGDHDEKKLTGALMNFLERSSMPVVRRAVDAAMRLMGEQFVLGQTIEQARRNSAKLEEIGFAYSYDMLGEAAFTAQDAARYRQDYINAIHAIGSTAKGANVYERPGISIKLSALHPRYVRAQRERVMTELLAIVQDLTLLARSYDIGINIDAEETERLDLSLDLLEALCHTPGLEGWNGIGFVVQAYGKRAPYALDFIIDLARRTERRIMVRLVKGAYWDSEIKKAQVEGMTDFPVYTRKCHTDISYIACARKLLAARDVIFPQFATHNARTLATIYTLAGSDFEVGSYEFQCLHGMGETLYKQVVGSEKLNRPARIYAPVGTHETLLAYLVRRLLENGANSSFVNQIGDESIPLASLIENPIEVAQRYTPYGAPHAEIRKPADLFAPERTNSAGLDLADDRVLEDLSHSIAQAPQLWTAGAIINGETVTGAGSRVLNPSDQRDVVGSVTWSTPESVTKAADAAEKGAAEWAATPPARRAEILIKAAELLEESRPALMALLGREAGKSLPNSVAEVREAVDFLRYYGATIARDFNNATHKPLGIVTCISPWNFPLAIFIGQIAAALAAGNVVLAKPAEETPLIAAVAVGILHKAGVPTSALHLLPGAGEIGSAAVADSRVMGVMFTGSTTVAQIINRQLEKRRTSTGQPVPFVAETGGQNAMIVDSSALTEQVVADVLASAFDSAGQRCSALRVLCVQDDCADHVLTMLRGAMQELRLGNPAELSCDVGPVITKEAADGITAHIEAFRQRGATVFSLALPEACAHGSFVAPTVIEVNSIAEIGPEVFGPVLHVLRYRREKLDDLLRAINATGYGLTFGLHTRLDSTVNTVLAQIDAGNLYVNRNTIGAVVGVQPFGGRGLSGTGPKAGGPLILRRLLSEVPRLDAAGHYAPSAVMTGWVDWLRGKGEARAAEMAAACVRSSLLGEERALPGPVGEQNLYRLTPRGNVLCVATTRAGLFAQISLALAGGNTALVMAGPTLTEWMTALPDSLRRVIRPVADATTLPCAVLLAEEDNDAFRAARKALSEGNGPIVSAWLTGQALPSIENMQEEQSRSINTTAAGGNASLMTLA
ncbi:bifunctional proline dehydrogenase/L-glutamate gamma-semialdehyde dehydrogenase PutA [Acetobacter peroxydans]|jgi:RHH-type proline utilization regulon transcriptional repressor/proline dehydrogenase/delta 1-pyrroline-5-carboxylate dehydrogenase|uniref:bifunctional proline dehydrogenase/L-glutamate gamma-semialdehyde dehydrogenase PutA n=1 Tax=Acetobacter peroxydans TaxID=104098 RepID=UPI00235681B6|nr:bifunctional proline dehydrogenase/L-glutamate gamma-semialdehyde dehydrogenase PutA [Acetobacter peroxydans]MCH4143681.1 bifunctional proline dehydrogenase/L-glutamate gamma-semialdehyde dehydrogenase PutA [Acetobacter peroxydans]MCI1412074.1 bifunctional proline dehydrogenase/L-glutamate gamma-semialdehyde dehydrogenase PutA [Acetobacter peroxydans]MCI1439183.1 bifunctional proline dehydrogenase/L-glutamate gamma-semialdehyde dehydrogenase PutA [Acetobacter peroxydans]MCI1567669.1 bifuncti